MIRNYLLLAVRNFRKQKLFSLINVLGLTIGILCCLLIFLFIRHEFSYDKFHKNGNNIYRVMRESMTNGEKRGIPWVSPMYAKALVNDYPDAVKSAVRVMPDNDLVSYEHAFFNEKKILLTDSNFFQFFSFKLLKGDPASVLHNPLSIVMTASTAKKYFGDDNPIGKVVDFNKELRLTVTGIAADVPANSHLEFDMIVPISNWTNTPWFSQWTDNGLFTYAQLNPQIHPADLQKQFSAFMEKYLGEHYRQNGFKMDLGLYPLRDIYFEGENPFDKVKHGSKKMVYIFMSIAALILLIACINFMNLATARATDRSKEVGLRKVMGAVRKQLIGQFIFESFLFTTVASILALLLLQLVMPVYTDFLGYQIPSFWADGRVYMFIGAIILAVGLLAGLYPALLLSSFPVIASLKGKLKAGRSGAFFRKGLVVFQFGICVLLIVSVAIVTQQMRYVRNTDLGFDKEQSMIVRLDNNSIQRNRDLFKTRTEADPGVASVSLMSGEPGGFYDTYGFEAQGKPGEKLMLNTEFSGLEYAKTLGLKIIAGRDISGDFPADTLTSVIINRSAATVLGYTPQEAIGTWVKNITRDSLRRQVVGVVEDFHYSSLRQTIGPLVVSPQPGDRRLALIKLKSGRPEETIRRIGAIYATAAADYPFEYSFLDERLDQLYKTESRQEYLLMIFSIVAICVACLGLLGLASYTAVKRTKEIGVRKVLGSSVENIMVLLSGDLLKPVLAGTVLAIPAGYFIMQKWLMGFAYRVNIQWWLFAVAALIAIVIALLTVGVQAMRAARINPTVALRSE